MSYLFDKINSLQWKINEEVEEIIDEMREVKPKELGLDERAAWRLYVDEEFIAVKNDSDLRTLRYYGGFEYVHESYVQNIGEYVFFHAEDERVARHLAEYFDRIENEENV